MAGIVRAIILILGAFRSVGPVVAKWVIPSFIAFKLIRLLLPITVDVDLAIAFHQPILVVKAAALFARPLALALSSRLDLGLLPFTAIWHLRPLFPRDLWWSLLLLLL